MELVNIENLSTIEQHVWDENGVRHSIPPTSVVPRQEEIAKLFLTQAGKYVRKYVPSNIPTVPGEPVIWVANMTGNPTLPKEISFQQTDRKTGLTVHLKKPNPLSTPVVVRHRMQRGQEQALDIEGKETALNLPAIPIKFPAAMRFPVSQSIANWLLMMDDMQETDERGKLVKCRAPTAFEPNESWDYEDIRLFGMLMDAPLDWKRAFQPASAYKSGMTDEVKEKLLHALFFFLVDERYTLPPKVAFDVAKAERSKS